MGTPQQELETRVVSVPDRAKAMQIVDSAQFVAAGELLKTIKGLRSEIDQTFDPIIQKQHEAHKEAIAQKRKVEAPLVEAENILKPRIATYMQEEERKRREEELRLQRQAQEEEERQQLESAVILEAIGEPESADALLAERRVAPPVILPRQVPQVAGVFKTQRWSAQVFNLMDLVKAVAAGKVPIMALQANTTFLNQQARSMKSALNYPGVRAVPEDNISARR